MEYPRLDAAGGAPLEKGSLFREKGFSFHCQEYYRMEERVMPWPRSGVSWFRPPALAGDAAPPGNSAPDQRYSRRLLSNQCSMYSKASKELIRQTITIYCN